MPILAPKHCTTLIMIKICPFSFRVGSLLPRCCQQQGTNRIYKEGCCDLLLVGLIYLTYLARFAENAKKNY